MGKEPTKMSETTVPYETASSQKTEKPWQFKKGQSGNPSGRPAVAREFRSLCREVTDKEAIPRMIHLLLYGKEDSSIRAAQWFAAYGYDLPTQGVKHTGTVGLAVLTPEEKQERLQANLRALAETHPDMVRSVLSTLALPAETVDAEAVVVDDDAPDT